MAFTRSFRLRAARRPAVVLLALRRGVVATLLAPAALGIVAAVAGAPQP